MVMEREEFLEFLKKTRRTRPNPKSQTDHVQLLENFLQEERGGKSLKEAIPEDLKAFAVWEESPNPQPPTHWCTAFGTTIDSFRKRIW